jgi:(heptosyl)LPS beta-1,4-glucosyltransferase
MKNFQVRQQAAPELSVVIITRNEEKNISRCIEHARRISNDIVVVDSGSTDNTVALAEKCGARVFIRNWTGYSAQKNFGNQQAHHDLVLSLDADEVVSDELAQSIREALKQYEKGTLLELNVLSRFEERFIYHGGWYPDWHTRIFEKNTTWWNSSDVHEKLQTSVPCKKIKLKGNLLHFTAPDKQGFREKMKNYALLFARNRFEKGMSYGFLKKYTSSVFRFVKEYFFKMGFLDGKAGWNIAWENALYTYLKYKYLENLNRIGAVRQPQLSID